MGTIGVVIYPKDRIKNKKKLTIEEINKMISESKEYSFGTGFESI